MRHSELLDWECSEKKEEESELDATGLTLVSVPVPALTLCPPTSVRTHRCV